MILLVRNEATQRDFILINKYPYIKAATGNFPYQLRDFFTESILDLKVADIVAIRELRKKLPTLVKDQPELHLEEIVMLHFPELFI